MAPTVMSGTSGALYYKPAGTTGTFGTAGVAIATDTITVEPYLGLRVNDPVKFRVVNSQDGSTGTGTLPAPLSAATTYYVQTYTAATGALKVSTTAGGAALDLTTIGSAADPNEFEVYYADYAVVGQVRSWSFEITRSELDVTTIGVDPGQFAPFRQYIVGFADGSGSCSVYVTTEDAALSNRMMEDVLQRQQVGCGFKLYTDKQATEVLSRSIAMDAVLLSAGRSVNPDDPQMVDISFRPAGNVTFDLRSSS
jgi:hypothetical protein